MSRDSVVGDERGVALLTTLLATMLMGALAAGVLLTVATESLIAASDSSAREARYAAEAGVARALVEIGRVADWARLLDGSTRSTFVDAAAPGARRLADGSSVDVAAWPTAVAGPPSGVWQVYAFGWLRDLSAQIRSPCYLVVMVAGTSSELTVRADAFGVRAAHRAVQLTIRRSVAPGFTRLLAWTEVR